MLFGTPEEHAANPPSSWLVVKRSERCWHLVTADGATTLDSFTSRKTALEARENGASAHLWEKERRWFAGDKVDNWKPWSQVQEERERHTRQIAAKWYRVVHAEVARDCTAFGEVDPQRVWAHLDNRQCGDDRCLRCAA